ncbi:hypothetical protein [Azospirillum lipoferum]|uniref:Uncharacterized protein n=1 Tax=Azospirillum lipoferum (strain 4B) TaxID=862719 RepID=G7ZBJ7_AZOL4|nr:hypothetical protein [Azospirillum lipoferum]CBS88721.1 conserved protein of unknown function [Azospirillum lipoferum 4B]
MTAPSTAPRFAHGVMTICLDGEDVELFANVRASRTICRLYGGLQQAFSNTNAFDFDTLVNVVNAAAGRVGKQAEATAEAIFAEGVVVVAPQVLLFLNFLAGGGKAPKVEGGTTEPKVDGEAAASGEAG